MRFSTLFLVSGSALCLLATLLIVQVLYFSLQHIMWLHGQGKSTPESVNKNENPLGNSELGQRRAPGNHIQKIFNRTKSLKQGMGININLATVACGNVQLVINMLKTAVLFSQDANLHIIIFTDEETLRVLEFELIPLLKEEAKYYLGLEFTHEIHPVSFPKNDDEINWRRMYLNCSNQRLFFPSLLPHIDSLIFLDPETLVVGNLSHFWAEFSRMDEFQLAAATQNHEYLHHASIYNSTKGHPYFGPRGLNAGTMLMNLTRMRYFQFEMKAMEVYKKHRSKITLADQDIMNIVFHAHPQSLMTLSCIFNFFWIHCPWKSEENEGKSICRWWQDEEPVCFCHDIYSRGVYIIRGNNGAFYRSPDDSRKSMFPWIYKLWHRYRFGDSLERLLITIGLKYKNHECYMSGGDLIQNALKYFTNLNLLQYYK